MPSMREHYNTDGIRISTTAISFFYFLCYNYYGDNMDTKELKSEILLLEEKLNNIWRLL